MTMRTLPVIALSLILAACGGKDEGGDSGDTAAATTDTTGGGGGGTTTTTYTGPTLLDFVNVGCDDAGWFYYAETIGWTTGGTGYAWEVLAGAAGWDEEHPLPSVAFGPNNTWDELDLTLADATDPGSFSAGTNTVFACGTHDTSGAMTFAITVTDTDGNEADCAIWGGTAADVLAGSGDVTGYNTDASAVAGCTEW